MMKSVFWIGIGAMLFVSDPAPAQTTNRPPSPVAPQLLNNDGIENFFKLTEKVYSGSSPETEEAIRDLQQRGIKTIVSVDGAKPDVETAKKYGLRYVHLPIGYDGVPGNRMLELVKVGRDYPGPVYIHCHHGMHRGPAGAAVICMGAEGWSAREGLNWLKQAGTATNYAGLYNSVREFEMPTKKAMAEVPSNLPEKMEVSPLVDAMVEIDERFEHLKLVKAAGFKQPPSHPDISPAHEALLLHELFKELLRLPATTNEDAGYKDKLSEAEHYAGQLQTILNRPDFSVENADAAFQKISENCSACHKAYRN